jgi:hypothetical protein
MGTKPNNFAQMPNADKEILVLSYSGGKTTSLREFYQSSQRGYYEMLNDLQRRINSVSIDEIKKLRSAILHRMQKYGVDTTNWTNVNRFLSRPKIAGKCLYEMTANEMSALIPKLEIILRKKILTN